MRALRDWLAAHWVVAAGFMAGGFCAIAPLEAGVLPWPVFLIYLHTPVYMIHQIEEHRGDRFRSWFNGLLGGGREVLTVWDVLVINCGLVWGVNLAALYAAAAWGPGWGLAAPYLMLVNAVGHIASAARARAYNPGLATAIVLFIPLGGATVVAAARVPGTGVAPQLAGLAAAILLHAGIAANAFRRKAALAAA